MTIYSGVTYPFILPKTKGIDAPSIVIGILLNTQNNPIAKTIPKAVNQSVYHISDGNSKPDGGVKKPPIKKLGLPSAKLPGFPDPYQLEAILGVEDEKIVEPLELVGTILDAVVDMYC